MVTTATLLAGGQSATASTTLSGWSCAAGDLLLLAVSSSDYKTGNPAGWSVLTERTGGSVWQGSYIWWMWATGAETSVAYVIGSASKSAYVLAKVTGLDGVTAPIVAAIAGADGSASDATVTVNNLTTGADGTWFAVASVDLTGSADMSGVPGAWGNGYAPIGTGANTAGADYNLASLAGKAGIAASTATGTSRTTFGVSFSRVGLGAAFKEAAEVPPSGSLSTSALVWDGSAWVPRPVGVWDGAMTGRPAQVWDGASWTP